MRITMQFCLNLGHICAVLQKKNYDLYMIMEIFTTCRLHQCSSHSAKDTKPLFFFFFLCKTILDFNLLRFTLKFAHFFFFFFLKDVESKYNQLCQRHSEQAATESEENKGTVSFFNLFTHFIYIYTHTQLYIKYKSRTRVFFPDKSQCSWSCGFLLEVEEIQRRQEGVLRSCCSLLNSCASSPPLVGGNECPRPQTSHAQYRKKQNPSSLADFLRKGQGQFFDKDISSSLVCFNYLFAVRKIWIEAALYKIHKGGKKRG